MRLDSDIPMAPVPSTDHDGTWQSETDGLFTTGMLTPTSTRSGRTGCAHLPAGSARHVGSSESDADERMSTTSSRTSRHRGRGATSSVRLGQSDSDSRLRSFKRQACVMSLIPVGFFTLIAIVGWLLSIHPPGGGGKYDHGTGNADPVDEFLKTQEEWVGVSDLVASFDYLPVAIKQGESNMIEVMIAIKHSHLRGRDRLVGEMEEFAELAGAISHKTIVWNNMVAATVDRVQNMNYHALRGLRGVQNSYSWPVIPAPASDTTGGLLTIAQGIAHRITSSLAHSQEQRVERFRVALVDEADRCGKDLGTLRVSGTELKADFARATRILKKMAEIARSEAFLTKGDRKDLEDSFWQLFGFYSGQIDNLNAHIQYLDGIAGDMMVGHRFMNDAIGRIVKLDDGFGHLQRSLKEMKFEKSSDLALRMDRIQSGIDKINKIRGSAHGAVSSGMYHQLRARIEAA